MTTQNPQCFNTNKPAADSGTKYLSCNEWGGKDTLGSQRLDQSKMALPEK
jgi:hypothetical protein